MGKNIVILSDGTGQRGGLLFDERRSNVYKLYRATRCGPDSTVNPSEQLAYYDPGLGTLPGGLGFFGAIGRKIYNIVSQATGLGLTQNIIDCYAAIIRMWEPGDRIFLLGFSRGAYTVRCVGGVLALCGVPTQLPDGTPLKRDEATSMKIAKEAVKRVYQHVSSPRDKKHYEQRVALAKRFRARHASGTDDKANAYPYFIGVFDTVAALASYGSLAFVAIATVALLALASWPLSYALWSFPVTFSVLLAASTAASVAAYVVTHVKFAIGLNGFTFRQTLHLTEPRMQFYDTNLNENVGYARHALSIDEQRADFARVPWGSLNVHKVTTPEWLMQVWFAGNHSDIGGSYPENESRLSDIALKWMADEAQSLPEPLKIDQTVLRVYPSASGLQHDECRGGVFKYAKKLSRPIPSDAPLHNSVIDRFKLPAVQQYDRSEPYRPAGLRSHGQCQEFYKG